MKKRAAFASYFKTTAAPDPTSVLGDEHNLPKGLPHAAIPKMPAAQQMKQFGDRNMSAATHKNAKLHDTPNLITCDVGDTEGFITKVSDIAKKVFHASFDGHKAMLQILGDGEKVARSISVSESAPVIQAWLKKAGLSLIELTDNGDQVWYLLTKAAARGEKTMASTPKRSKKTTALFTGLQALTTSDPVLKRLLKQKQQMETEYKAFMQKHKLAMADINEKIAQRREQMKQEKARE